MRLGRYDLLYRLAKGGMGEVFVARRKGPGDIEKRVVIKRIRSELARDPRFVEMFLREARLSMTLTHRNIASVFDFGRAGQELFLALEHVHGRDLAHAVRASKAAKSPLSPTAAAHVSMEVCRALDYAHNGGKELVVHRDLSPKNILLSFAGEVLVTDFGLATDSSDGDDGKIRGTPRYMSPEQAYAKPLDARSDLFSLGLVLYELLAGLPAYVASDAKGLIARARKADIKPLPPSVPEELVAVVERATRVEQDERFQTAAEMLAALDNYTVAARASGAREPGGEISEWLESLFEVDDPDAPRPSGKLSGDAVLATTYLEDGERAVSRIRDRGDDTLASMAETVADAGASADETPEPEKQPKRTGRGFLWLAVVGVVGAAAVLGVAALGGLGGGDESDERPAIDAAATTTDRAIDAAAPAPAPDAQLVPEDAAPRADARRKPVAAKSGWIRVSSRPWARVRVSGGGRCPETPCKIKVGAGRHTVVIENPVTGARTTRKVTVDAGKTTDISVALPPPAN